MEAYSMETLLNVEETAKMLRLSPWTVRKKVAKNIFHAVRIGRRVLIEPDEIRRIIEEGRRSGRMSRTDSSACVKGGPQ
jgi:excisionase family DNA binding protein